MGVRPPAVNRVCDTETGVMGLKNWPYIVSKDFARMRDARSRDKSQTQLNKPEQQAQVCVNLFIAAATSSAKVTRRLRRRAIVAECQQTLVV